MDGAGGKNREGPTRCIHWAIQGSKYSMSALFLPSQSLHMDHKKYVLPSIVQSGDSLILRNMKEKMMTNVLIQYSMSTYEVHAMIETEAVCCNGYL